MVADALYIPACRSRRRIQHMNMRLPTRPVGRTKLSVPELGFGASLLGNLYDAMSDADARDTALTALQRGITYFDTAPYYGFGAVTIIGDLVDRSDLHGGRTNWGDVPLQVRNQIIPGAALFRTAGTGIAWPGSGANGHPASLDPERDDPDRHPRRQRQSRQDRRPG